MRVRFVRNKIFIIDSYKEFLIRIPIRIYRIIEGKIKSLECALYVLAIF